MSIEDKFNAAVNVIRGLPKNGPYQPSNDMLLSFYSLYKQATRGKCTDRRPAFWDVVNRAKWDAWNRLGDLPKEEAMQRYVDELKKIVETMSYTDNVANFMEFNIADLDSVNVNDLELVAPEAIQSVRSRPNSPFASSSSREATPNRLSPITPSPELTATSSAMEGPIQVNGGYHLQNGDLPAVGGKQQQQQQPQALTNGYYYYQNGNVPSDLSDDEYIDTVDDSETESTFRPIEIAASGASRARNSFQQYPNALQQQQQVYNGTTKGADQLGDIFHNLGSLSGNPEVAAQLARTIHSLNASVQLVNNRINVVEESIAALRAAQQRLSSQSNAKSSGTTTSVAGRGRRVPAWWPFEEISPRMLTFMILWPLIAIRISGWLQQRRK